MDECIISTETSDHSSTDTSDPLWCDTWRPPPLPIDSLPQIYKIEFSRLLQNTTLKLCEQLKFYADRCPYHLSLDWTTIGETKIPTAPSIVTTPLQPQPIQEVATASFAGWLVLGLVLVILIAAVGVFIYYKKKHGRYILKDPCLRCFTSSGERWARISSKFSRYNSRESESYDYSKGKLEFRTSGNGEAYVNYASNENYEFLLTNQNGRSVEQRLSDDDIMHADNVVRVSHENNVTRKDPVKPNDNVDYSPVQTKGSPKKQGRLSSEQDDSLVELNETLANTETVSAENGALNGKENVGALNSMQIVGALNRKENVGALNSRENVGALNGKENVGALNSMQIVGALNRKENVGALNSRENVGALNGKENVGALNSRENVGAMNSKENGGALNSNKTVDALNSMENLSTESVKDQTVEPVKKRKESVGVLANKEHVSTELVKEQTAESVKKRKKKFKLRHANKVHSSPVKNNDQEIKIGEEETDKRKTY